MRDKNKVILITGATGFLGSAITKRLLFSGCEPRLPTGKIRLLIRKNRHNKSDVEDLILNNCLSEPNQVGADESPYGLFKNNVKIYEGDITSKNLGLDENVYESLCYEIDEVFHCAAATHFGRQQADELMMINVNGTKNMLQFADSGKQKRFHYVSTAYVAGKRNDTVYENELVDEGPLFNNEYERSKFIAEQMVTKYAKDNAIPYTIYRPSIIVGDSSTGVTCRFDNFYLFAKVLFNIQNGLINHESGGLSDCTVKVPGIPDALINLVPVDYVADAIVAILKAKESVNKIFHIANPDPPELSELRDLLMPVLGINGINVKIDGQMEYKRLSPIERLFLRQTKTYYSYLFSRLRFDCRNTRSVLESTGIICPAITRDLVSVLVDYAILSNWGERKRAISQQVEMV